MNEIVALVAIISAAVGATFAVWWNTSDKTPVSHSQLAKAVSLSVIGAISLVNLASLPSVSDPVFSWVGLVIMYLFVGSGIGKASNHLQLNTPPTTT